MPSQGLAATRPSSTAARYPSLEPLAKSASSSRAGMSSSKATSPMTLWPISKSGSTTSAALQISTAATSFADRPPSRPELVPVVEIEELRLEFVKDAGLEHDALARIEVHGGCSVKHQGFLVDEHLRRTGRGLPLRSPAIRLRVSLPPPRLMMSSVLT